MGRAFIETGVYDISGFAKYPRLLMGMSFGKNASIGSSLDIEAYINNGPFWLGVRNLGGGFSYYRNEDYHYRSQSNQSNDWTKSHTVRCWFADNPY